MSYNSIVLAIPGLVGFWELAEPSGTTATDTDAIQGGVYTNPAGITLGQGGIPGGAATAALFTPGTGYVAIADNATQHVTNTFSIEFWWKVGTTGAVYAAFSSATSNSFIIETSAANPPILVAGQVGIGTVASSSVGVPVNGAFHHCVWTRSGSGTDKIYIDGVDVTTGVTARNLTTATAAGYSIGRKGINNTEFISGVLAKVALYNVQLTPVQVSANFAAGSVGAPVNTVAPSVSGLSVVGSTLTTTNGTWTDDGSPTFTRQWTKDGANIVGQTGTTYVTVSGDIGHLIGCTVTDSTPDGNTSAASNTITVTSASSFNPAVLGGHFF